MGAVSVVALGLALWRLRRRKDQSTGHRHERNQSQRLPFCLLLCALVGQCARLCNDVAAAIVSGSALVPSDVILAATGAALVGAAGTLAAAAGRVKRPALARRRETWTLCAILFVPLLHAAVALAFTLVSDDSNGYGGSGSGSNGSGSNGERERVQVVVAAGVYAVGTGTLVWFAYRLWAWAGIASQSDASAALDDADESEKTAIAINTDEIEAPESSLLPLQIAVPVLFTAIFTCGFVAETVASVRASLPGQAGFWDALAGSLVGTVAAAPFLPNK